MGTGAPLTARGTLSDGTTADVTSIVTWTSSVPAVATVSNAAGSQGVLSAQSPGTTTITVVDPTTGVTQSESVVVTAAVLKSIALTPASLSLPLGTTAQLVATATYSDGFMADVTQTATWSSTSGAVLVSNAPGSSGQVSAATVGGAVVSAADPATGITRSVTVTATASVLRSIGVAPENDSFPLGTGRSLFATGTYSDHTTQDLTAAVTWSSSGGIATVSNAAGSSGLVTGTAIGTATLTATDPATGISGTASVTVTAPVCNAGLVSCGAACVNEETDAANCGACGVVCAGACSAGTCVTLVTTTADSGPGSLRDAVASVPPGGTIAFAPSLAGRTITVLSPISVGGTMTIRGPGASTLTISGGGARQIFSIAAGGPVGFSGLTFANGNAPGNGGAIDNCAAADLLTVTDSVFLNNQCSGASCYGGAVCSSNGGTFTNVVFKGNASTYYGGGLSTWGASGSLTMNGVQFFGNSATWGGGVVVYGNYVGSITNGVFAQNYAEGGGGGILAQGGGLVLTNSDVVSNSDGIEAASASLTLDNVVVANDSGAAVTEEARPRSA